MKPMDHFYQLGKMVIPLDVGHALSTIPSISSKWSSEKVCIVLILT